MKKRTLEHIYQVQDKNLLRFKSVLFITDDLGEKINTVESTVGEVKTQLGQVAEGM